MGHDLDARADQYALAATTFHLLTGSPLFQHSNPAVVISHHLNAAPPRLGKLRPDLDAYSDVFARAMSKDPANRFDSCGASARALTAPSSKTANRAASAATQAAPTATPHWRTGGHLDEAASVQRPQGDQHGPGFGAVADRAKPVWPIPGTA